MIRISLLDIEAYISYALESKKKNILFVSRTLEYDAVLDWFSQHSDYRVCRSVPVAYYKEENGILTENEDYAVIDSDRLKKANDAKCIWFHHAFSEKSILNFEGFLDIIKNRFYINRFPDGTQTKYSLENMPLFIGFTTPHNGNDWAALDDRYYSLFDDVYLVE